MKQGVKIAFNALKKKIMIAVAPYVLAFFGIIIVILIAVAPVVAAKDAVDSAVNSVGTFFERFAGFFSGNGWNTDEEAFFKLLGDKKLSCDQATLVTATIMYYYQTVPESEIVLGTEPEDTNSDGEEIDIYDEDAFPYGEMLPDLKKLVKKIKNGKTEYESYVKDTFLEKEPYSKLLEGYENDDDKKEQKRNQIYEEMKQLSESVECPKSNNRMGQVCSYNLNNGETITDLKVQLLHCHTLDPLDTELIDFEKYILGVVLGELRTGKSEGYVKSQAVAARSYSLTRGDLMGKPIGEIKNLNGQSVLSLRACTGDQAYCDPDEGCWGYGATGEINLESDATMYPGEAPANAGFRIEPFAPDAPERNWVKETAGEVLLDKDNKIVYANYASTEQNQWSSSAESGKNYRDILLDTYSDADSITATCQYFGNGTGTIRLPIDDALNPIYVTSEFGYRADPFTGAASGHEGMDFGFPTGTPIYSIAPGYVAWAGFDSSGYGNYVVLGHDIDSDGLYDYATLYGHCSEVLVETGDSVAGGQEIAKVGSTGRSTGPHLHFNLIDLGGVSTVDKTSGYSSAGNGAVNPRPFLEDIVDGTSIFNEMIKAEQVYYNQGDYSNVPYCSDAVYSGDTLANAGCGATSFAMIAASLRDSSITPTTIANDICGNSEFKNFRVPNGGTASTLFTYQPFLSKYGLTSTHYTSDYEKHIKEALKSGKLIIVNVRGGLFNPGNCGHYITLMRIDENGQVLVHDPGNRALTKYHNISDVTSNISNGIWVFK